MSKYLCSCVYINAACGNLKRSAVVSMVTCGKYWFCMHFMFQLKCCLSNRKIYGLPADLLEIGIFFSFIILQHWFKFTKGRMLKVFWWLRIKTLCFCLTSLWIEQIKHSIMSIPIGSTVHEQLIHRSCGPLDSVRFANILVFKKSPTIHTKWTRIWRRKKNHNNIDNMRPPSKFQYCTALG